MSEVRLIDSNAAISAFADMGQDIDTHDVIDLLKEQPTVDAVPVEWIQGFMNRLRDKGQTVCVAVIQGMLEAYCTDG